MNHIYSAEDQFANPSSWINHVMWLPQDLGANASVILLLIALFFKPSVSSWEIKGFDEMCPVVHLASNVLSFPKDSPSEGFCL